jgi:spore coat protein U-like protein
LIGGLLGLFSGPGSSIPLYVDAGPASALKAGVYTGTVVLRWYYYTCSGIGVLGVCLGQSSSSGFSVNLLGQVTNWGVGTPALLDIVLTVTADCAISAPNVDFGSAPLVSAFDPVTQTLQVRCTRDQPYVVGLTDGSHALGSQRRLQNGPNHLLYELYNAATNARWGANGVERRSSGDADINGGLLDGVSTQGFVYRAEILSSQPTPPAGVYTDDVQVLVEF